MWINISTNFDYKKIRDKFSHTSNFCQMLKKMKFYYKSWFADTFGLFSCLRVYGNKYVSMRVFEHVSK